MDTPPLNGCPPRLAEGLLLYARSHIETGSFLRCVLENDLHGAAMRGDLESLACLRQVVHFCVDNLPDASWGTPEKVKRWLERK